MTKKGKQDTKIMDNPNKPNAIGYCRVGTIEQEQHGFSLKIQDEECRKIANSLRLNFIKSFNDVGSANDMSRQGLQGLLAFCENKQNNVKNVIVARIDRIARNLIDILEIEKKFEKLGINLLFVNEQNVKRYNSKFVI